MADCTIDLSAMSPMGRRRVCEAIADVAKTQAQIISDELPAYSPCSPAGKDMTAWRDGALDVQKQALRVKRES